MVIVSGSEGWWWWPTVGWRCETFVWGMVMVRFVSGRESRIEGYVLEKELQRWRKAENQGTTHDERDEEMR